MDSPCLPIKQIPLNPPKPYLQPIQHFVFLFSFFVYFLVLIQLMAGRPLGKAGACLMPTEFSQTSNSKMFIFRYLVV